MHRGPRDSPKLRGKLRGPTEGDPRRVLLGRAIVLWIAMSWAAGCGQARVDPGPVWLVTWQRSASSEPVAGGAQECFPGAAAFPRGHAVAPELEGQWPSLWTGHWPRTLEGADLTRVPSLLRSVEAARLPFEAWLPELDEESAAVLADLGLRATSVHSRGAELDEAGFRATVVTIAEVWRAWCAEDTRGLLWLHVTPEEAQALPDLWEDFLGGARPEAVPPTRAAARIWLVELGGSRPQSPTDAGQLPAWARLADLDEVQLAARAWMNSPDLEGRAGAWSTVDWAPTLAECMGLSVLFTADGGEPLWRAGEGFRILVGQQRGATHRRQVAWVGDLKLWRAAEPLGAVPAAGPWPGDHPRLFDWRADPFEREDLGPGSADRVLQMERLVRLWEGRRRARQRAGERAGWWSAEEPRGGPADEPAVADSWSSPGG